jgi:hypothetical protein
MECVTLGGGPLPGLTLVVLEPDRMLMTDVVPREDAYAQERSLLRQALLTVTEDDLGLASALPRIQCDSANSRSYKDSVSSTWRSRLNRSITQGRPAFPIVSIASR